MAVTVAATTWGDPTAVKRVLLIHGITRSSQFWNRLAHEFASRGYFVVAPDLLGHGCAKRSEVYTIAALVDDIRPLLSTASTSASPPYDIVVGHSLGGIITATILPLLASSTRVQVVLVDPPLELAPETVGIYREMFTQMVSRPARTPEEILRENPRWTKEDAVIAAASVGLCGVDVVQAIFDQNVPWSFTHHLSSFPENVQVMVLAADPAEWACIREEDVNSRSYPRVMAKTVQRASHLIPLEEPGIVIEAALGLGECERESKEEGEEVQAENLETTGVVGGAGEVKGEACRRDDGTHLCLIPK